MVDLREYGDPVLHYAVKIDSLKMNNVEVPLPLHRKAFAIFDTGTTGCILSEEFSNDFMIFNPRQVELSLRTIRNQIQIVTAQATRDSIFVVKSSVFPWFQRSQGSTNIKNNINNNIDDKNENSDMNQQVNIHNNNDNGNVDNDPTSTVSNPVNTRNTESQDRFPGMYTQTYPLSDTSIPYIIIVGLAFLQNSTLTVDIDARRIQLTWN